MRINADFSQKVAIATAESDWIHSPEAGVDRIMLDRIGGEVARATSIVRYAPGSSFARHEHAMGEEFLVLDGVFSDEHGDFSTGTYVRNPPGSGHAPHSDEGCRILVKLRQFDPGDLHPVVIDTVASPKWAQSEFSGVSILALHQYQSEQVQMLRMVAGSRYDVARNGVELFVVSGSIQCGSGHATDSWIRLPVGCTQTILARDDAVLWTKSGHFPDQI